MLEGSQWHMGDGIVHPCLSLGPSIWGFGAVLKVTLAVL